MTNHSTTMLWAHFRFSVIGALLAAPPPRGELKAAIRSLADKVWTHPITGQKFRREHTWALEPSTQTATVRITWKQLDENENVVQIWNWMMIPSPPAIPYD